MGWIQAIVLGIQLIIKIFDAVKERNEEIKKKKTEAVQSGIRAVIDKDVSRLSVAINDINNL